MKAAWPNDRTPEFQMNTNRTMTNTMLRSISDALRSSTSEPSIASSERTVTMAAGASNGQSRAPITPADELREEPGRACVATARHAPAWLALR